MLSHSITIIAYCITNYVNAKISYLALIILVPVQLQHLVIEYLSGFAKAFLQNETYKTPKIVETSHLSFNDPEILLTKLKFTK